MSLKAGDKVKLNSKAECYRITKPGCICRVTYIDTERVEVCVLSRPKVYAYINPEDYQFTSFSIGKGCCDPYVTKSVCGNSLSLDEL
jgi:hypothetical protein